MKTYPGVYPGISWGCFSGVRDSLVQKIVNFNPLIEMFLLSGVFWRAEKPLSLAVVFEFGVSLLSFLVVFESDFLEPHF